MRSVMIHQFSQVPKADIPRSRFNRSHGVKTTFDAGYLVPVYVDLALPGDTFTASMTTFARLATPVVPIFDNLFCDSFFFAVPIRLVWDNWEKFNGAQTNPDDSTDFLVPQMTSPSGSGGYQYETLSDYFGIPTQVTNLSHSSLWHRAYNLIWNEWFRDQNLQDSLVVDKDDGPDDPADYVLKRRNKRHDYFTSCLPWPQKGPAVPLPLGTEAPIRGYGGASPSVDDRMYFTNQSVADQARINYSGTAMSLSSSFGTGALKWQQPSALPAGDEIGYNFADLSEATAATINALRQAFQLQKLYERDARGGTRYTEIIKAHFGVTSPDARLQRPEYLGGGSSPIHVHPVAQTSSTDATTPQGNLSAFATSGGASGFSKSFTEHCLLIGLVSVRADLTYQQGLNRMFSARSRFEFYWPALSHIGEQAVLNKEIYAQGSAAVNPATGIPYDDEVFGYQERYAEYRYKPSIITGKFRSANPQSLDNWHLSQEFGSLPVLNSTFIEENPPIDRVIATPNEPHMLFDALIDLKCARPMPVYGVPGLIDHF